MLAKLCKRRTLTTVHRVVLSHAMGQGEGVLLMDDGKGSNADAADRARSLVHSLSVSNDVFAVMVEAIAKLSLRRGAFVTLRDVVAQALDTSVIVPEVLKDLEPNGRLDGPVRIYLRLDSRHLPQLERFRAAIYEQVHKELKTRELVYLCCLLVIDSHG